jgi:hypothetical protein
MFLTHLLIKYVRISGVKRWCTLAALNLEISGTLFAKELFENDSISSVGAE